MAIPHYAAQHLTLQVRNTALLLSVALLSQFPVTVLAAGKPFAQILVFGGHLLVIAAAGVMAWRQCRLFIARGLLCCGYLSFVCCSVTIWITDTLLQHFLLVGAMTCGFLFHRSEYRQQRAWILTYCSAFLLIEGYFAYPMSTLQQWARLSNSTILALTTLALIVTVGYLNLRRWKQVRVAFEQTRRAMEKIIPDETLPAVQACQSGQRVRLPCVCVLFADMAGFQKLSLALDDDTMVTILDALYREFDVLAHHNGVTRLKTNGDEYMAATGLSQRSPHTIARQCETICNYAQALIEGFQAIARQFSLPCHIRVGIACGPVTAGVIGRQRPTLDIWGKTVNFASELEHAASHDAILVDAGVRNNLSACCSFSLAPLSIQTKLGSADAWRLCPVSQHN